MPLENLIVWCPHCGRELREQLMTRAFAAAIFSDHLTATDSCRFDRAQQSKEGVAADYIRIPQGPGPRAQS